jgi:hypothetical protein
MRCTPMRYTHMRYAPEVHAREMHVYALPYSERDPRTEPPKLVPKLVPLRDMGPVRCCAQHTGVHEMVVEALLIAIYSTWVTS